MTMVRFIIPLSLVLACVCGAWAFARNRPNVTALPPNPSPVTSPSTEITTKSIDLEAERWLGVILAHEAIDITPRQEGKLRTVDVRIGDHVVEGGIIARLDTTNLGHDLLMAEAAIKAAEAEQKKASVEVREASERYERRKALAKEAVATTEEVSTAGYQRELAQARYEIASAQVNEKRARAAQLRQFRADAELRAPFDAIVAARYIDPGTNVATSTRIARLISSKPPFVRFAVPEQSRAILAKGRKIRAEIDGIADSVSATISTVSPEIDSASRTTIVEATLDRPDEMGRLRSGAITHVMLETSQ